MKQIASPLTIFQHVFCTEVDWLWNVSFF